MAVEPRRHFLKLTVLAAGAAGAAACKCISSVAGASTTAAGEPASQPMNCHAMTADGRLVKVAGASGKQPNPLPASDPDVRKGVPGRRWVMVIDLARCDGCGACQRSCSKMHELPNTRQYIKILKMQDSDYTAAYNFPQPCFHCDNPPCTKVCPVDATFKREDGIVLVDNTRCIGCRFCVAACPYGARSFNWSPPAESTAEYSPETGIPHRLGTVEKCDFCPDMAAVGQLPSCVSACPMAVMYFGDQNEDAVTNSKGETVRLSSLLSDNAGYRQMEELGTEPRLYYLPPKNRMFPAPPSNEGSHDHG